MAAIQSGKNPLARLMVFMISLSIAGSILAGAHYYAVDLPQQNVLQAPENAQSSTQRCETCTNNCNMWLISGNRDMYNECMTQCQTYQCSG